MKRLQSDSSEHPISVLPVPDTVARIITLFLVLQVLLSFPRHCFAQNKVAAGSSSQQQAATAPAQPADPQATVPLPEIVTQTEELTRLLKDIERRLDPGPLGGIDHILTQLEHEISAGTSDLQETIAANPTLGELDILEHDWNARAAQYAEWQELLRERIKMLENDLRLLDAQQARWQATLRQIESDPALKEISDRVRNNIVDIQAIRSGALMQMNQMVILQNKISLQDQTVSETVGKIAEARKLLQQSLFVPDSPPLWRTDFDGQVIVPSSYKRSLLRFTQFVKAKRSALYLPVIVFLVALFFAIGLKRRLPRLTNEGLIPEGSAHCFSRPISLAMLAALTSTLTFGQPAPLMMRTLMALLFLLPVFRLSLPLIRPAFRPLTYSLIGFGLALPLVEILGASAQATRWVSSILVVAALVTFFWLMLRSRRSGNRPEKRTVVMGVRIGLLLCFASLVANILGYTALSGVLRSGTILSSYLSVILYTGYLVTNVLISVLVHSNLIAAIASVRSHREKVLRWASRAVGLLAVVTWLYASLNFFTIREEVLSRVAGALSASVSLGTLSLSLGDVLAFVLTLALGVHAARVTQVLLQEDVLPRFSLKRGLPNTVSTLVYFTLIVVFFFVALAAGGADFSRFTLMTGAFGLGVGFGLQQVINNLASGMLLLLERPISVGDVLEVEGVYGVVKRIGMRSSTIRTYQGAEIIVPNSNLVTNQVTNWTLSERNRRVDIPVAVAYGTDPERVIELLVATASSQADVVRDPPPLALLMGFGDSSLNFELRFWAPHASTYQRLRSKVAVSVIVAFREAGIVIPFPQRELLVKRLDSAIDGPPLAEDPRRPDAAPESYRDK